MPRPPRITLPSVPLHLIQRGNNRLPCFLTAGDCLAYLAMLRESAVDTGCALHAYVLMNNHVHLLLSPDAAGGASMLMQRLGTRYVQYFNRRHGRTGTLWEGRFRSSLVEDERYLMVCHRYIELNPVRAGMVAAPSAYPWSSHAANAYGRDDALLTPHPCYARLGTDAAARQAAYRRLFDEALPEQALERIRQAGKGNRPLGAMDDEILPKTGV